MKYMLRNCAFLLLLLLSFSSCRKEPHFDEKPFIEFRRVEESVYVDENRIKHHDISIVVYFQDGDGNLGLSTTNSADQQHPFDKAPYDKNFVVKLLSKQTQPDGSSEFVEYVFPEASFSFGGKFPRVSSDERPEPLEGEIKYTIKDLITSDIPGLQGLVAKFDVYIYDRALNQSNVVRTNEITLLP
jgi:hypothetical protein